MFIGLLVETADISLTYKLVNSLSECVIISCSKCLHVFSAETCCVMNFSLHR